MNAEERMARAIDYAERNAENGLESVSGVGSSIGNSRDAADLVACAIDAYRPRFMLDVPCGDCQWIKRLDVWDEVIYTGIDINPDVIAGLKSEWWGTFECLDAVCDELPCSDLVVCRDLLQHLSLDDGVAALRNIISTGCDHILITTHQCEENKDLRDSSWSWRPLSMFLPPFSDVFGTEWEVFGQTIDGQGRYGKELLIMGRV